MTKPAPRYAVRRFTLARVDGWEAYDTITGECASFGMTQRDAKRTARALNEENSRS